MKIRNLIATFGLVGLLNGCDDRLPIGGYVIEESGNAKQLDEAGKSYSPKATYSLKIQDDSGRIYSVDVKCGNTRFDIPLERLAEEIKVGDRVEIRFFNNYTQVEGDQITTRSNAVLHH